MTDNSNKGSETTFDEVCRFLITVGKAAHSYGSSTAQIESFLSRLIVLFGYQGTFRATATEILFAFREKVDSWQRIHLEALPGAGQELNRLARVGEVVDAVEDGKLGVAEATQQLEEIHKMPQQWGLPLIAASVFVVGAGFALVMGSGGKWDAILSAFFSLVVLGIAVFLSRFGERVAGWLPFISTLVVGMLAAAAKFLLPELQLILVIVSSVLIFLPGYAISIGIVELVSNHVLSGMANLMNGLLTLAKLIVGGWLGVTLVSLIGTIPQADPGTPPGAVWTLVLLPLMIAALCFAMQTAPRDFLATALVTLVAILVMIFGGVWLGAAAGVLLATIAVVVLSNLWGARTRRPTAIPMVSAINLLVSGSSGVRGMLAILGGQTTSGEQLFFNMFVVAFMVLAGLLVGNTLVPPKSSL